MVEEIWKQIKGFENYEISNCGRVRHGERVLKPFMVAKRYLGIHLMKNGTRVSLRINRLVAEHFLPVPEGKASSTLVVDHKNLDKMNNHAANLEWVAGKENTRRALAAYGGVFRDKERMGRIRDNFKELKTVYIEEKMQEIELF